MCCWFSFIFTVGWKWWVLFYIFLYKSFQKQMIYVNNQDGNIKVVLKIRLLSGWISNIDVAHAICIVITYISLFSVVTSIHCLMWNQSIQSYQISLAMHYKGCIIWVLDQVVWYTNIPDFKKPIYLENLSIYQYTKGPSRIVIIFIYDNYYRKRGGGGQKMMMIIITFIIWEKFHWSILDRKGSLFWSFIAHLTAVKLLFMCHQTAL